MRVQILTCQNCSDTWERPVKKGKTPRLCEPCRGKGIKVTTLPSEPKPELTEAELFKLEQEKKRAADQAKREAAQDRVDNLINSMKALENREREVIVPNTTVRDVKR